MNFLISVLAVLLLIAAASLVYPVDGVKSFIALVFPYIAGALFVSGIVYRLVKWGRSPVPFRITTTSGQQKSLPWLKTDKFENPHNIFGVIGRMLMEILFFRSLFRNTKHELGPGPQLAYGSSKFLWLGGLVFHWSFLIIFLRHFRFFAEPVPGFIIFMQNIDGMFEIGVPPLFMTDVLILIALSYLLLRRIFNPLVRYVSQIADYFPLMLIISIAVTGILMRHFIKVDLFTVKKWAVSLLYFSPVRPEGAGGIFYIHVFLVFILALYMPFSKLIHFAGVFFSPTRAMANTNRMKRHINPWNPQVKVHTYEEWEDEFRDKLKTAGYEVEKG